MAHKLWCGKSCGECVTPCQLDGEIPCSPDCLALNLDGSRDVAVCVDSGCDAVETADFKCFEVTITETLKLCVEVEADSKEEAEQYVLEHWRNSEYILEANNFVGVEVEAVPTENLGQ